MPVSTLSFNLSLLWQNVKFHFKEESQSDPPLAQILPQTFVPKDFHGAVSSKRSIHSISPGITGIKLR